MRIDDSPALKRWAIIGSSSASDSRALPKLQKRERAQDIGGVAFGAEIVGTLDVVAE